MNSYMEKPIQVGESAYTVIFSESKFEHSTLDHDSIINEFLFHKCGALEPLYLESISTEFDLKEEIIKN